MATVNLNLIVRYNAELGTFSSSLSPSTPAIYRGDTVVITIQPQLDAASYVTGVTLSAWDGSVWVNADPASAAVYGTISKVVRADSPYVTDSISLYVQRTNGSNSGSLNLTVTNTLDSTPNAFDLGPDLAGLQPNDVASLSLVVVAGINTGVTASVINGTFTVNNGLSQTSATVFSGDKIQVYGQGSSSYNTPRSVVLTVGGVSDSVVLTTSNSPASGTFIAAPFVNFPISLQAVKNFFGGNNLNYPAANNLRSYLRGGPYVPDIIQNNGVPTEGTLSLSNLLNSGTTLFFKVLPRSQSASANTVWGAQTLSLVWSLGSGTTNFDVGYGIGMRGAVNYRYTITEDIGSGKSTGAFLSVNSGSANDYNPDNDYVRVSVTVGANIEARYSGTITIYIQSKYNTSIVHTTTMKYFLNFFGP